MAVFDADLAVMLVISTMAVAVLLFVVLLIAMLVMIHRDPWSHIDADRPSPPEQ
jgi:hypothetical protein